MSFATMWMPLSRQINPEIESQIPYALTYKWEANIEYTWTQKREQETPGPT